MNYRKLTPITEITIIARGKGVDVRHELNRTYGHGRWRKLKGVAVIEYEDGSVWRSELYSAAAHTNIFTRVQNVSLWRSLVYIGMRHMALGVAAKR